MIKSTIIFDYFQLWILLGHNKIEDDSKFLTNIYLILYIERKIITKFHTKSNLYIYIYIFIYITLNSILIND